MSLANKPDADQHATYLISDSSDSLCTNSSTISFCVCTCCHNTLKSQLCIYFKEMNYDFANSIVCEALSKDISYRHAGGEEFICKTCHNFLRKSRPAQVHPVMPTEANASPIKG